MNAKTPLVALSVATILLSAQAPYQEATCEAVAMAPAVGNPTFEHKLRLHGQANDMFVVGGTAGDYCAIVAGLELTEMPLPGNAMLRIEPLALFILGKFDANGEFALHVEYDGEPTEPASVYVQALTLFDANGMFGSSDVGAFDFDGVKDFAFRHVGE
jgi:hypothetical protein